MSILGNLKEVFKSLANAEVVENDLEMDKEVKKIEAQEDGWSKKIQNRLDDGVLVTEIKKTKNNKLESYKVETNKLNNNKTKSKKNEKNEKTDSVIEK